MVFLCPIRWYHGFNKILLMQRLSYTVHILSETYTTHLLV